MKFLAQLINVVKGEKATEGRETPRTGGEVHLETLAHARRAHPYWKKELGMGKADALRHHPVKSSIDRRLPKLLQQRLYSRTRV